MSILAISSSPRRGGNSELALRSFCRAAEDKNIAVEFIRLQELKIEPCRGCELCAVDGLCVVKDRMQPLYEKVAEAKGMVLATPIYFGSLSAQLKIFMDRFQCWWHAKYTLKKPFVLTSQQKAGFIICTGALPRPDFGENVGAVGKVFFHSTNYDFRGCLFFQKLKSRGEIKNRPDDLQAAYDAGIKFAESLVL